MFPFGCTTVMKVAKYQRLMRMGAGALMLVLVQGLCLTSSASAGCSHSIGVQSDPFVDLYLLDEVIFAGSSSVPGAAHFPGELPAPRRTKPCSGLSCPNSSRLPVSTTSPQPVGADQWGTVGTGGGAPDPVHQQSQAVRLGFAQLRRRAPESPLR